jgi:tetratricopeptide (TPR) repeat protein
MDKREEALKYFGKALQIAQEKKDQIMLCECYYDQGRYYLDVHDTEKALDYLRRAEQLITEGGQKERITSIYISIADVFIEKKDPSALEYAEKGLRLAKETKAVQTEASAYRALGLAQALVGQDPGTALRNMQTAHALAKETDLRPTLAEVLFAMGRVYAAVKNKKEAVSCLKQAKQIYAEMGAKLLVKNVAAFIKTLASLSG